MAINTRLLRAKIIEKYGTQTEFSNVLGMTDVNLSRKMQGQVGFSRDEIVKWAELLGIETDDIPRYFFAHEVP